MDYNHIHHTTLRTLLEFANEKFADHPFLYFIDGDGYTYREFYDKAAEVSHLLYKYGLGGAAPTGWGRGRKTCRHGRWPTSPPWASAW